MSRWGWGLRYVRLDDGTLVPELVPVELEPPPPKPRHRATGKPRGRPKGTNGRNDERDWFLAATVAGARATGMSYAKSVALAGREFQVGPDIAKRAYANLKGNIGHDFGLVPEPAERIAWLRKKHLLF
jgi:hypothetical protein